jgi:hypothetical protein
MDMLKKFFPFSFNVKEKDITNLVVSIIIYVVAGVVVGLILGLIGSILGNLFFLLGWIVGIPNTLFGLYCLLGIVISVLNFFNILK